MHLAANILLADNATVVAECLDEGKAMERLNETWSCDWLSL